MLKFGHLALIALPLLSGCATDFFPEQDARIDQSPLTAESREALKGYFLLKDAKAFVFDPATGRGMQGSGYNTIEGAETAMLARCEALIGAECQIFALNNQIVWTPDELVEVEAENPDIVLRRTTAKVNFRNGPGTHYSVIEVLAPEQVVEVTHISDEWQTVRRADGRIGYVHGNYLDEILPAAGPGEEG